MNNKKRECLKKAIALLKDATKIIEDVEEEESGNLYNIPENLWNSDNYETMESAVDFLREAMEGIDNVIMNISDAMD